MGSIKRKLSIVHQTPSHYKIICVFVFLPLHIPKYTYLPRYNHECITMRSHVKSTIFNKKYPLADYSFSYRYCTYNFLALPRPIYSRSTIVVYISRVFFFLQNNLFIFKKRDTKSTENKSLHTFNKYTSLELN